MSRDLHIHRAFMNQGRVFCFDINGPDAVYFMPGTFVTKHQQVRVGTGELHMVEPGTVGKEFIQLSCFYIDGKQGAGQFRFIDNVEITALGGILAEEFFFLIIRLGASQ